MTTLVLIYLLYSAWRILGAFEENAAAPQAENLRPREMAQRRESWWFRDSTS